MDVTSYLLGKKSGGGSKPPVLQDKEVTINENGTTNITADEGYDGLSEVEVTTNVAGSGISEYFTDNIANGTTQKTGVLATIKKVKSPLTVSGTSLAYAFRNCSNLTEVPQINGTSSVTTMQSMFENCTSLTTVDLSSYTTNSVTNMSSMFSGCNKLTNVDLSNFNTTSVTNMQYMFSGCNKLTSLDISDFDTSGVQNMGGMFSSLYVCKTIQCDLDFTACTNIASMFQSCNKLENLGTISNLGKGFLTTQTAHNAYYAVNVSWSPLTHDSIMNIINGLYDIATAGVQTQDLILGAANLAKLSQAEIDIATNKGWTVS